jgi:sulfate adenylyltransferase large subunit
MGAYPMGENKIMESVKEKEHMNIVIVGHVDHGKSTLIGRLLYDTNSIPEGIFEEIKKVSEELGREVEFAYLLDSLEEEREQNVTIDTTQIFFKTLQRDYVIIDAPGHKEFLKNMITGSSQAEAAILVVSAKEGVQEQTKRHAYILSMLGLKQVIVVVNKMDSVGYEQAKFNKTKEDILNFLVGLGVKPSYIIPVSAMKGDNISKRSENMKWYDQVTVLEALDSLHTKEMLSHKPLRFPIQDVYKIDDKRILVGRIEAGMLRRGDEVVFLPSDKKSKIKSIEVWNKNRVEAEAGESIGVTLEDPLFIQRGEIICCGDLPTVTNRLKADVFWMCSKPLRINERLVLKCATQDVWCIIERIGEKINSSTLELIGKDCNELRETEVGKVIIRTEKQIVTDNFNNVEALGRFVLVKDGDTAAGGIILNETISQH